MPDIARAQVSTNDMAQAGRGQVTIANRP